MEVNLSKCEQVPGDSTDQDFLVHCRRPDGTLISVLIPDSIPSHYGRIGEADAQQEPYGLNLVCRGHYT